MLKDASAPVPAVLRQAFPDSKILVAIPAFNEGPTIGSVVLKARQFASEVVVVDDGSSDDTAETAALAGAHVIQHARGHVGLHAPPPGQPSPRCRRTIHRRRPPLRSQTAG